MYDITLTVTYFAVIFFLSKDTIKFLLRIKQPKMSNHGKCHCSAMAVVTILTTAMSTTTMSATTVLRSALFRCPLTTGKVHLSPNAVVNLQPRFPCQLPYKLPAAHALYASYIVAFLSYRVLCSSWFVTKVQEGNDSLRQINIFN